MAEIAVKNHHNGSLNPKAHFQNEITVEQVLKSPIVAAPLGVLDCFGVSDGAAAAIVTRGDRAKNFRADPIYIKSMAISAGPGRDPLVQDYDFAHVEENVRAAERAYAEAGIKNPRAELSMAEVHDCFTIHEMCIYEDLGLSRKGGAKDDIEAGPRQVKNPRLGLTHNLGGTVWGGIACICITGNELDRK